MVRLSDLKQDWKQNNLFKLMDVDYKKLCTTCKDECYPDPTLFCTQTWMRVVLVRREECFSNDDLEEEGYMDILPGFLLKNRM